MDRNAAIKKSVISVLMRIVFFLVYYIGMICLGLAIIGAVAWLTVKMLPFVLALNIGRLIFLVFLVWAGLCCFALAFAFYLIKPLFSFHKDEKQTRVEVTREACPKLFEAIEDVAKGVGTKMPKHVYLTTEVNACVFYNTTFWSIFFPVRKNLEIGLGLFEGLSTEELKSIIAHEFGHFSQKSMKVGSTVYVANSVICDLINTNDSWDQMMINWNESENSIWAFFGGLTIRMTNWVKSLTYKMYRIVQKENMVLSRQMEFDADTIACNYIGSDIFISAMYKVEQISVNDGFYQHILRGLIDDHQIVSDYFDGKHIFESKNPDAQTNPLTYELKLSKPYSSLSAQSRVEVKDIWSSHPSTKERIANARLCEKKEGIKTLEPAWNMIPENIRNSVSDQLYTVIRANVQDNTLVKISDDRFAKLVDDYFKDNYIHDSMRPYFSREVIPFDLDKVNAGSTVDNPFNDDNSTLLNQYEMALSDLSVIKEFSQGRYEVNRINVDGKIYTRNNPPIEEQNAYIEKLKAKASEIDVSVYQYILNNCNEKDRPLLSWLYNVLFYSQFMMKEALPHLLNGRDYFYQKLQGGIDDWDLVDIRNGLNSYFSDIQKAISYYHYRALSHIASNEVLLRAKDYEDSDHTLVNGIPTDVVNEAFQIVGDMYEMHRILGRSVSFSIAKIAQDLYIKGIVEIPSDWNMEGRFDEPASDSTGDEEQEPQESSATEEPNEETINVDELEWSQPWMIATEKDGQDANEEVPDWKKEEAPAAEVPVKSGIRPQYIVFVVFALIIGGVLYTTCDDNVPTKEQLEEESQASNNSPVIGFNQETGEFVQQEQASERYTTGEITDGTIGFTIPAGIIAEKTDFGNGTYVFDLIDNVEAPSYNVRLLSSSCSDFNDMEFEKIWAQAKQQNEEGNVSAEYGQLEKQNDNFRQIYSRKTIYKGDGDVAWNFVIVYDEQADKIAILSGWSNAEQIVPYSDIIQSIRF